MKNTTENLKPEHIYLNLANCSEEERKEVIAMLPEEKVKGDYRTDYYYNYLVYFSKAEKWFVNFNVESKTEVNFQEFKEIMGGEGKAEAEKVNYEKKFNDLKTLVQSESVYWCLRSGVKYPSNFDFEDNGYLELYKWIRDDSNNV